ncbi:SSI family serine proteinase inhibitor [Streptomyces lancefieldiae]|uniref:SSI family serine proteinase inhibitor n=1 Tax=Streptomyces lancefieldiae TaxID=3075520 RepID=A0ABU3AN10_9ACTN|nr:SSI family serine proteinase inhibitor [Streptomyces sp. DSM 40712]MDT0611577.1 SSI family serine proteinase inhibitor [Streptomyces sp. DSM 40712]
MTHLITAKAARAGLLAAAALLVTCATPAQATAEREPANDWLLVTVTRDGAPSGTTRSALLSCDPPRGHARAARACAELETAGGRIADIPPRDTYCPMLHAPVTAHARGKWRGRPVEYRQTFPNTCLMAARTGAVFALDTEE